MKRIFACFLCLWLAVFVGCSVKNEDFFDVFRGAYTAEVEGTLYGICFSAKIEMGEQGEGAYVPATITFYAPKELSGTTLSRGVDGGVTVKSGELTVSDMGGVGAALFSLFECQNSVDLVEVTEEGRTRLLAGATEFEFLPDGTPYSIKEEHANVTVVSFYTL